MDKFSLLQEREASVWKRPAEKSSKGTKVGWKSFMPEKLGLKILHAGKTGIENDIVGIGNQGGI